MGNLHSTTVTVSSKGWVVIPSMFRKKIGLKPGMQMAVTEEEGKIILTPQIIDPVDALFGKLAAGKSLTKELLDDRKNEKNREKAKIHSR